VRRLAASVLLLSILVWATLRVSADHRNDRFVMEIGVDNLDEDFEVLTTKYFRTSVLMDGIEPIMIFLFYTNPANISEYHGWHSEPREKHLDSTWYFSLPEQFGSTVPPWRWPLVRRGEFPADTYELSFLLGVGARANFVNNITDVRMDDALRRKWSVSREFVRFPYDATPAQLQSVRVRPDYFEFSKQKGCFDFYQVRILFSRTEALIWRFNLHWYIAIALMALIIVSFAYLKRLDLQEILALCLGIAFFAVPILMSLQTYLPQTRINLIERVYALEVMATIALAGIAIFLKTRARARA